MTFIRLFRLFSWKNRKHILFSWISLLFIWIGCISALFLYLYTTDSFIIYPEINYDNNTQNEGILKSYFAGGDNDFIYYAPTNQYIDELMEAVRVDLSVSPERILPFQNSDDMFLAIEEKKNVQSFAILFKNVLSSSKGLRYAISSVSNRASTATVYLNDKEVVGIKEFDEYIASGFFTLQQVIDKNFIKIHAKKEPNAEIKIAPLPNREMVVYESSRIISFAVIYSLLLCILLFITFLVPLVEEKQNGIKEFLNLSTPYSFLNGVTFYLMRFLIYFFYSFIAILLAYFYNAIGITPIHYIIVLFTLLICSAMCYTMLVSVFFNSVFYAKAAGVLLLFVPCVLFFAEGSVLQYYPFFFSGTTFLEGMKILQIFTNKHKASSFNDLFINITTTSYRLIDIYLILLIQCFVYSLLYLNFSFIFPGPGGISQPFYFFLKPSFYKSLFMKSSLQSNNTYSNCNANEKVVLTIRNLTKIINSCCGENKKIINNLTLDIFDNRITVLLGHNGAGKTTTINMIIGAVDSTSGEISVCGYKDPSSYRHLIGYCPQFSIFMEYLNCFDHLKFFAQLRGLDDCEAEKISNTLLCKLRLTDKANEPGRNLSGGMKRRLSLGMAVTGNTRLIILDEPSSGLDPISRRQLWDILLELRKSQSILLTTHCMEEAEVLGDYVAILSHGKMICDGTPMGLKRTYKCGYILKLLIKEDQFERKKTMDLIQSEIPDGKIKVLINPTLCINLPYEQHRKYPAVLKKLEENSSLLGITSISITNSSLEDVFSNCTSADEVDLMNRAHYSRTNDTYMNIKDDEKLSSSYSPKFTQQSFAIFYKKFIFLKRLWSYSLFMFSLPFVAIGISHFIINSQRLNISSMITLDLDLRHLAKSEVFIKISPELILIKEHFVDVMKNANSKPNFIAPHQKLTDELLKMQHNDLANFYQHVIGAVDVSSDINGKIHVKMFYSTNIIHSSSIILNLIDNVLLRYFSKENIQIETSNIPIQKIVEVSPAKLEYYAYIVPVGWFLYMLYYISLSFEENKVGFKKLQNTSSLVYWSSFTLYDILLHAIVCLLTYVFQKSLPFHEVYDDNELLWLTTTFMFYGYAYLPILYICSSTFKSLSTLSAFLFSFFTISTIIPDITSANKAAMDEYSGAITVLCFLPDFAIKHQIKVINEDFFLNRRNLLISSKKIGLSDDLTKLNITGKQEEILDTSAFYLYSAAVLIICEIFLIFIWENKTKKQTLLDCCRMKWLCRKNNKTESSDYDEEDNVRREKDEVDSIFTKHLEGKYPLIVSKLQKSYDNLMAVNQISFAVKQGECFGLLGLNGAGKTSTFEMITGNMKINGGNAFIDRVSVHKNINVYKSLLGYCPQGNALISYMTSYEVLKYMAMIRGIRNPHNEVGKWLEHLDLVRYKSIPICNYSGGTKRKLNTALAMIGNPKVLFLDEPTAGVDPKSRRFIWKCIQQFQNDNKTIVLTSHSMDECENLCNRLAIMANGRFQCIGSIPILKMNFASGFTIMFRIKEKADEQDVESFKTDVGTNFRCTIREEFAGIVTYFVQENNIRWSTVFEKLERLFNVHRQTAVEDYSVKEATLEDIFLKFESKCKNMEISFM